MYIVQSNDPQKVEGKVNLTISHGPVIFLLLEYVII